jgi:hypothetical protein
MPDETVVPLDGALDDPELAALAGELEQGGLRAAAARAGDDRLRPSPGFAVALRSRLVAQLPSPVAAPHAALPVAPAGPLARPVVRRPVVAPPPLEVARPTGTTIAARTPTVLPAPRWTAIAIAAAFILSVVGIQATFELSVPADLRTGEAFGATLVRGGASSPLAPDQELREGDEIVVAEAGHATVEIGRSRVRMDGGAALRIDAATDRETRLEQLAGRAYHRVAPGEGAEYRVTSGPLTWTAVGTAFDLRRAPLGGGERLTLLAVEHDVVVAGPDLRATVPEGRGAVVTIGQAVDLATAPLSAALLDDPWLRANAERDRAAGFPLGVLGTLLAEASPSATPSPSPSVSTVPPPVSSGSPSPVPPTIAPTTAAPAPTPKPTARPTPKPTVKPTPKPTAKPTPTPTATPRPTVGTRAISVLGCHGGVVLDWSAWSGDTFDHYTVLRAPTSDIPAAYPPQGGATEVDGTYTQGAGKTSGVDLGVASGTWHYRAFAFDAEDRVIAASAVGSAEAQGVKDLGALAIEPREGGTAFDWTPYGGAAGCFTYYKLVASETDETPSYLEGSPALWAGGSQAAGVVVQPVEPGTYWFRLQAIRVTDLGKFVVAETEPATYTVP